MRLRHPTPEDDALQDRLVPELARFKSGLTQTQLRELVHRALLTQRGLAALDVAMQNEPALPAGLARAAQTTENTWQAVEATYGLLSSGEVAELRGARSAHRSLASGLRERGQLLAVKRLNAYRYPGFQFDRHGAVRPQIPELIALADELDWPHSEVILWLVTPSGAFGGERPVEHLDDPGLLQKARDRATVEW